MSDFYKNARVTSSIPAGSPGAKALKKRFGDGFVRVRTYRNGDGLQKKTLEFESGFGSIIPEGDLKVIVSILNNLQFKLSEIQNGETGYINNAIATIGVFCEKWKTSIIG